jgi:hypothetical protein
MIATTAATKIQISAAAQLHPPIAVQKLLAIKNFKIFRHIFFLETI